MGLTVVSNIKTLLKYLFIFVDQNEMRENVIMLFRLAIIINLQYFFFLSLNSGAASGRTAQTRVTSLPQSALVQHYLEVAAVVG